MSHHDHRLPEVPRTYVGESASIRALRTAFEPLFFVRLEHERDFGVDGNVELLRYNPESGKTLATNRRAYFQLKHSSSPSYLGDGSVTFALQINNINYLADSQPALYLLYLADKDLLLFRWWHEIHSDLLLSHPGWEQQETINVHFIRRIDHETINEIAIEINAHAEQVRRLRNGPGFIRNFKGTQLPEELSPTPIYVGRTVELLDMQNQGGQGAILPILGPPGSGKTEIISQYLSIEANLDHLRKRLGGSLALVFMNCRSRTGSQPVLRALSYALGVSKLDSLYDTESIDSLPPDAPRTLLLEQLLPARLQQFRPIFVVDNAHELLLSPVDRKDISEFLHSDACLHGITLLASRDSTVTSFCDKHRLERGVSLAGLSESEARDLVTALTDNSTLAAEVIANISGFGELMLPGVIRNGLKLYLRRVEQDQSKKSKTLIADAFIDATEPTVRELLPFLFSRQLGDGPDAPRAIGVIFGMSVLATLPLERGLLTHLGLTPATLHALVAFGWVESRHEVFRLTTALSQILRERIVAILSDSKRTTERMSIENGFVSLLNAIARHPGESRLRSGSAIEEALSWVRRAIPHEPDIESGLIAALLPYIADDLIPPVSAQDLTRMAEHFRRSVPAKKMEPCLADLYSSARFGDSSEAFLKCLRETIEAAMRETEMTEAQLRIMDTSAVIGYSRHHRAQEVMNLRSSFIATLTRWMKERATDNGWITWAVSWGLNTATLAITLGALEAARHLEVFASMTIEYLVSPQGVDAGNYRWLRVRLLALNARLTQDPQLKTRDLRRAVDLCKLGLLDGDNQLRWTNRYVKYSQALVEFLWTDAERDDACCNLLETLKGELGESAHWPLWVRAKVAAFLRNVAALDRDPDERLAKAQAAVDLLASAIRQVVGAAKHGDTRALLVLSRSYAFAAVCVVATGGPTEYRRYMTEALSLASNALAAVRSAEAWELKLRLLDQSEIQGFEGAWYAEPLSAAIAPISSQLQGALKECRAWLESVTDWGTDHGTLALWCYERQWRADGSLERWAVASSQGNDWPTLPNSEKRLILKSKYDARRSLLLKIKKRAGQFAELALSLTRLESQFQRLLAIYGDHHVNYDPVFRWLSEASGVWPDDFSILLHEARTRRYVWSYGSAIQLFRRVVIGSPIGAQRQDAMIDLVETILSAVRHGDSLQMPDGTVLARFELLAEANKTLAALPPARRILDDRALLYDAVDFEMGKDINWKSIDEVFMLVVGGVGLYAETVVNNLHDLIGQEGALVEHITDLVRENFTSAVALAGMGSLYLRRAETRRSADSLDDCKKAFAIFDACRILEQAWLGSEAANTSYRRARAILTAAKIAHNPTPFPFQLSGKSDGLHFAEALFQRAVSLSVGDFHVEVRKQLIETTRLRRELLSSIGENSVAN
jgi:hypothetical protein